MSKLAKININNSTGSKLTQNSVDMPFSLTLKYPLENNYNFKKLKSEHLREFQSFLDKVSSMTFSQVDNLFLRNPDTNDKFQGKQQDYCCGKAIQDVQRHVRIRVRPNIAHY